MSETFEVRVVAVRYEAQCIHLFELCALDGGELPPFTAGAHIPLHLENGAVRDYSLINSQAERHRYVIAVSLDPNGAGSRYMFETPLVGRTLRISPPRNNFALFEDARLTVLLAGGIGITPLRSMIHRLEALGRDWVLHYGARDRESAAFVPELEALEAARPGCVQFNFDSETGRMMDLAVTVALSPPDAHLYCCGPTPMLEAFRLAAAGRDPATIHLEYFSAPSSALDVKPPAAFTVTLARSGLKLEVPEGCSILDVVRAQRVYAESSCEAGVCGTCEVRVLEGTPDHRDYVLTEDERQASRTMMICVSGSLTDNLVIDL